MLGPKKVAMRYPNWVFEINDDEVSVSIMAFMFIHTFCESGDIDDLRAEIREISPNLSSSQVEKETRLLIKHGCVKKK